MNELARFFAAPPRGGDAGDHSGDHSRVITHVVTHHGAVATSLYSSIHTMQYIALSVLDAWKGVKDSYQNTYPMCSLYNN